MQPATSSHHISIGGAAVPIIIRKHKKSRHIVLRYHPLRHAIALTLPRYATIRQGLDFAESKRAWIERELSENVRRVRLEEGVVIPVLGENYRIKFMGGRGNVRAFPLPLWERVRERGNGESSPPPQPSPFQGEGVIEVHGDAAFMARRVRDWLKKTAQETIYDMARSKAAQLGARAAKISVRDTRSHWGSCNHAGRLSFSWRLVLAPPSVLEYVVCHEVAHLKELNHSAAFWEHVASLCPHWKESRSWLKTHGAELYWYG